MADSLLTHRHTRRNVLASLAALPFLPSSAGAEAGLLALGRELDAALIAERAADAAARHLHPDESDALINEVVDATAAIVRRIAPLKAATGAGLRVKAKALTWCRSDIGEGDDDPFPDCPESAMTNSIIRDLLDI